MKDFATKCVHAGTIKDDENRGINSPIYTSTSFEFIDRDDTVYPRYLNTPNEQAVATKIAALEETEAALIFSSGMAAISTTVLSILSTGDHMVFQKGLYGGTTNFILSELKRFGMHFSFANSQKPDDIMKAVTPATKLIYIETPSNPLLNITDISAIAEKAKKAGILTAVDNTFASPVNQQPARLGIDIILHSATKYIGGHSDICAGVVATSQELIERIHKTALNLGGSLNAITLYLIERSLKTLDVRVQQINKNAQIIAEFLAMHPKVNAVNYPGLPEHPDHGIARKQMSGFGGMLSFELKDQDSIEFQKKLKLIKPSMSLGGVETIVSSPAHTSHRHLGEEGREKEGIAEGLIRMSVGIESFSDLVEDLDSALE
ncbi:MAG: aminotransferase class I/II-fold pyridoxal phosphate-dependent enzyme [Bacteroidales bacterium]|jgi:cystathionine beta-lyase|nr:aminotransferase class I/II-fold pyridoxal phosphate-dependent enzyme [Bacteroidales bacterium]